MAKVHIVNIAVLDNPSSFLSPFQFEITFDCVEDLQVTTHFIPPVILIFMAAIIL